MVVGLALLDCGFLRGMVGEYSTVEPLGDEVASGVLDRSFRLSVSITIAARELLSSVVWRLGDAGVRELWGANAGSVSDLTIADAPGDSGANCECSFSSGLGLGSICIISSCADSIRVSWSVPVCSVLSPCPRSISLAKSSSQMSMEVSATGTTPSFSWFVVGAATGHTKELSGTASTMVWRLGMTSSAVGLGGPGRTLCACSTAPGE